jgi:hypothetical protein
LAKALHLATSFLYPYCYDLTPADELAELRGSVLLQHVSFQGAGISPTGHLHHLARTFALSSQGLHDLEVTQEYLGSFAQASQLYQQALSILPLVTRPSAQTTLILPSVPEDFPMLPHFRR